MSEKTPLGQIVKESILDLKGHQKVFEITLFAANFRDLNIQEDFEAKLEKFCDYILDYLKKLEENSIKINKVYFEALDQGSEAAIKIVNKMMKRLKPYEKILNYLLVNKAELRKTEDEVLLNESLAWLEALQSLENSQIDVQFYIDSLKERDESISLWLSIDLEKDENAVIFISYERNLHLKNPLKLINIRPPITDELEKMITKIR